MKKIQGNRKTLSECLAEGIKGKVFRGRGPLDKLKLGKPYEILNIKKDGLLMKVQIRYMENKIQTEKILQKIAGDLEVSNYSKH